MSLLTFNFIPILFIPIYWLLANTENILYTGLLCGVFFGKILQNVLTLLNKKSSIETEISQNRSIYKSIKNAILIGIISGLIVGIISGLNRGLIFGLIFCLISGGSTYIQHYTLRFVLYYNGSTPLDYVQFLEYATMSRLLQRISGRYRFIHTLLQEHFAAMSLEK
ncbi:MAG: hypothetical protein SAL70_41935 [Scytonema sp. PMC 1070.18]|nr:hypothetical protein [Scytonema sp. PMC 1070.18]